jgi:hypothetical protein
MVRLAGNENREARASQEERRMVMFTTVTKQLKRAISTVKSVLANAGTAATLLDPTLRSYLKEGEQIDGLGMVQLTLVRWIEDDHASLEELELAHRETLRKLKLQRLGRDEQQTVLYNRLLRIRKTFEDAFGPGTAAIYLGLEPRMRDLEPLDLRRHARETATILESPRFAPPKAEVEGIWENPGDYARQIRDALTPFQTTLDEIEAQKREVEIALQGKTEKLAELQGRLRWSIHLFEAIYQLAGQGFHAERLRLTVPARPNGEGPVDEEPEPDVEEPQPDTPEPSETSG